MRDDLTTRLMTRADAVRLGMLASEEWRQACEVRAALAMPSLNYSDYLAKVEKARGVVASNKLHQMVSDERLQLRAGRGGKS